MGKMKETLPEMEVEPSEVYMTMTIEEVKKAMGRPMSDELAEEMGKCSYCVRCLRTGDKYFPRHNASMNCESGGDNHCSCDICY
jgi:uncharacterized OB-fold protein